MVPQTSQPGMVVFVGAGPGNPDLLTVRAREVLAATSIAVTDPGVLSGVREVVASALPVPQERIDAAPAHPIHQALTHVARLRKDSVALQRGLQLNVRLEGEEAVFYRVFQHQGVHQTALVLLNKGDTARTMEVSQFLEPGLWRDGLGGEAIEVGDRLSIEVPANGLRVLFHDAPLTRADTLARLDALMAGRLGQLP